MTLSLKDISTSNWLEAIKLKVRPEQERFVATNLFTIAESKFKPMTLLKGFFLDKEMIGLVAVVKWEGLSRGKPDCYFILRYMIDEKFQGKGHGKVGLLKTVKLLKHFPDCHEILTSIVPGNISMQGLVEKAGFKKTGRMLKGETIFRLKVSADHLSFLDIAGKLEEEILGLDKNRNPNRDSK